MERWDPPDTRGPESLFIWPGTEEAPELALGSLLSPRSLSLEANTSGILTPGRGVGGFAVTSEGDVLPLLPRNESPFGPSKNLVLNPEGEQNQGQFDRTRKEKFVPGSLNYLDPISFWQSVYPDTRMRISLDSLEKNGLF